MSLSPSGAGSLSAQLDQRLHEAIAAAGGWLPFDRFMAMALYEPELGYYARGRQLFGSLPASGSDFVTAPEMTPLFGQALARQVAQALERAQADTVVEFGAGSGALAEQLLETLGESVDRYSIVELSGPLRERQAQRLQRFGPRVRWLDAWPAAVHGVIVGNEVLDAMPVQVLVWDGQRWHERGVTGRPRQGAGEAAFAWADRPTALQPPHPGPYVAGSVTEIHPQAEAFICGLAATLQRGAAFFIDYGFTEAEYYHPQRTGGTLMCHRAHRSDTDPLADVGDKDITAHVNFSGVALAGQDAGLDVLGYTTQAHFLINCGLLDLLGDAAALRDKAAVNRLLGEHEMGELFKVVGFGRGVELGDAIGFSRGDRSHTL